MKANVIKPGPKVASVTVGNKKTTVNTGKTQPIRIKNSDDSWNDVVNDNHYTVHDINVKKSNGDILFISPSVKDIVVGNSAILDSEGNVLISLGATSPYNVPDSIVYNGDGTLNNLLATRTFTCQTLQQLINIASAATLYNDLNTALKLGAVIQLLTTSDLKNNLTGDQVNSFIQALATSVIYADLSGDQRTSIIPLFSVSEMNGGVSTTQMQGLNSTNVQKLVQSQINSLVNAQLDMLNSTHLTYVLLNDMSAQFLNDTMSVVNRNKFNKIYCDATGQTTVYATGDDGTYQAGKLAFGVLPLNNSFGNPSRFTDITGGQTYEVGYTINHGSGNAYATSLAAVAPWATHLSNSATFSLSPGGNTYTDFRLVNFNEILSICNKGLTQVLNYAPFNIGSAAIFCSTTLASASGTCYTIVTQPNAITSITKTNVSKITSAAGMYVRTAF